MNTLTGKSIGIALLLAAGLLAALFAMGVFSATSVGAQAVETTPANLATLTLTVNDGPDTGDDADNVTLDPDFDTAADPQAYEYSAAIPKHATTLTVTTTGVAGTSATVKWTDANGMGQTTAITDTITEATVDLSMGIIGMVEIVAEDSDSDDNTVQATNFESKTFTITLNHATATSSDTAGGAVRVTLSGIMAAGPGQVINVKFPSAFGLPTSIDPSSVLITTGATGSEVSGNPNDVTVRGSTVELLITDISEADGVQTIAGGDVTTTIIFSTRSGITNPTKASSKTDTYEITVDSEGDAADIEANAIVRRSISLDPKEGASGADVKVTGKGYSDGTATVFIDADMDGVYDDGEEIGSAIITDGTFTLTTIGLKKGTADDAPNSIMVNAVDSANAVAPMSATYTFKAGFTVKPAMASWGEKVTITLADWPSGTAGNVTQVRFGGSDLSPATMSGSTVTTTVPDDVRPGKLVLQLFNGDTAHTPTGSIEIVPLGPVCLTVLGGSQPAGHHQGFRFRSPRTGPKH